MSGVATHWGMEVGEEVVPRSGLVVRRAGFARALVRQAKWAGRGRV